MAPLLPESIGPDAPRALATWIDEARASAQPQATSMTLATAAADGRPSARMVFVRGWGPRGIEWITDEASRKARDLMAQPHAAGVFFWAGLGRQARVEGPVHLLAPDEVAAYMARRRPEARRAARAWRQGERLESRADLRRRLAAAGGEPDPPGIPDGWIGHRLEPRLIEFWQEDPDGLHDRLVARLTGDDWSIERVAP
jgi:pyridoxamine 5'-phosphate oxidase